MAKNEVGEFELVLGNKQLLTVFFIVVTLLGVFFTMGYIVGRNSGGAGSLEAANRKPSVIEAPAAAAPLPATSSEPAPAPKTEPKPEEPVATPPAPAPVETKPAAPVKTDADRKREEAEAAAAKKREDAERKKEEADRKKEEKEKKKREKAEAPAPAHSTGGAPSGTYLQLAAVPRAEADLLISVLQKKGFMAAMGPGPEGSNLFRVLVGPLSGPESISRTRLSLDEKGMPGSKALVRKF